MAPAKLLAMKKPMSKIGSITKATGRIANSHQFESFLPKTRTSRV